MKSLEQCDVSMFSYYPSYNLRYTCKAYINSILLISLQAGMGSKNLCMVNMLETMLSCDLWLTIVYLLSSRGGVGVGEGLLLVSSYYGIQNGLKEFINERGTG